MLLNVVICFSLRCWMMPSSRCVTRPLLVIIADYR